MYERTFYDGFSSEERDYRKRRRRDRPLRWQTIVLDSPVVYDALYTRVAMVEQHPFLSTEALMEDLLVYVFNLSGLTEVVEGLEVVVEYWEYFPEFTDDSHAARSGNVVYLVVEVAACVLEDEDIYEEMYREHVKLTACEYIDKVLEEEYWRSLDYPLLSSYENSLPVISLEANPRT